MSRAGEARAWATLRRMAGDDAKRATYQDVLEAPEHLVAEIVRGHLSFMPRPRPAHARAASRLGMGLSGLDGQGEDPPGGWIILDEPELHLVAEILVPDLAGRRRERMPEMPTEPAYFERVPERACPTGAT
jgi:hypothetical protein